MSQDSQPAFLPQHQSYLNNDGIDDLKPTVRKHRVSSLSLSDLNQWQNGLTKLSSSASLNKQGSHANLKKVDSLVMLSRNSSIIKRKKKTVIDHPRVASYAFCFDIDGVILRGPDTIPEAVQAIKLLNGENKYNIKVPSIFVTNGGGKLELQRAEDLSKRLGTEIRVDQIIQGHTPMRDLVPLYKNVLVVGGVGNICRHVAESYGFKNVYTPLDILKWNPAVSPYHDLTEEELKCCKHDVDFSKISFDAILVFADSRNWAADQQIILELLLSKNGVMGTESMTYDEGPEIYFAHSDFIWATNYKLSRYGMGALQVSIAALFKEHTLRELKVHRFGKPQVGTFKFANKVLSKWRKGMLDEHLKKLNVNDPNAGDADILINDDGEEFINQAKLESGLYSDEDEDDEGAAAQKLGELSLLENITLQLPPASTVYFVGDTPESDIRFANSHDDSWFSILVKTGVYQDGTVPKYKPKHLCANVLEAVEFSIEREHAKELVEWNDMAVDEDTPRVTSKINFNDFVTTPSEKKAQEEKERVRTHVFSELEELEIPDFLSEQLAWLRNVGA
ncbi:HAD-superfamily subfamily IIA hydrolase [Metschnikowia bicuspidata]|uniref:HAD-superfamily subfamily IIA hydrolase n=1 Tax=Metschnikowia bicuspidata TaxID=27322 RepID=A0A4P9Z8L2_9ASCO|nr:HAD-superfamily subfamily IIA hydrolase [Metschnikowia bicuspidata]